MKNKISIIAALDLLEGKCVRLSQGDFNIKTEYDTNPVDVAKMYQDAGIKRLHIVDLDGAKTGKIENLQILEDIVKQTDLEVDFGGGVHSIHNVKDVLNAGAKWVCIGSIAVRDKILWKNLISSFGAEKFLLGADVKNRLIAINGWQEITKIKIDDFIQENIILGVERLFITDIEKDGLLQGPAIELYQDICKKFFQTQIIASGGVRDIEDIELLAEKKCYGVIIGKALYENKITLQQLKKFLI